MFLWQNTFVAHATSVSGRDSRSVIEEFVVSPVDLTLSTGLTVRESLIEIKVISALPFLTVEVGTHRRTQLLGWGRGHLLTQEG